MRKFADTLFLAALALVILVPVLLFNGKPDQISEVENRALAELPPIQEGFNAFTSGLSEYIDDRIGLRDQMMQGYNSVVYETLNTKHSDVIRGDDGWLFYANDLPDYAGTNIDETAIAHQTEVLAAINAWCEERGIIFILAVGPNKSEIYDNLMPEGINKAEQTKTELIAERLREQGILVSYAKDDMLPHRDEQELYYALDTHWNSYGARYMMDDMVTLLGKETTDFTYIETPVIEGDLMVIMGMGWNGKYSLQVESEPAEGTVIEELDGAKHVYIHSEGTDKIVCYRDSFNRVMLPFYTYYFHGNVFWDFNIDWDFVEQEAPKYLILSCVERFFDDMIAENEDILMR